MVNYTGDGSKCQENVINSWGFWNLPIPSLYPQISALTAVWLEKMIPTLLCKDKSQNLHTLRMYDTPWHAQGLLHPKEQQPLNACMWLRLSRSDAWRLFYVEDIRWLKINCSLNPILVAKILPFSTITFFFEHHQGNVNRGWRFWNTLQMPGFRQDLFCFSSSLILAVTRHIWSCLSQSVYVT